MKVINALFLLDRDKATGKRYCELSFESGREGRQLPPEARLKSEAKDEGI